MKLEDCENRLRATGMLKTNSKERRKDGRRCLGVGFEDCLSHVDGNDAVMQPDSTRLL